MVLTGLIGSGAGAAFHMYESNEVPSVVIPTLDELPTEIAQGLHGLVCAEGINPCTIDNALGDIATKNQVLVSLQSITPEGRMYPDIAEAVIAKEDQRFTEHSGIDVKGVLRALVKDIQARDFVEGASGITRQVANILYPKLGEATVAIYAAQLQRPPDDAERELALREELETLPSIVRQAYDINPRVGQEIREMILARTMEKHYSKDEILEKYLNSVYFGRNAYGIEAAARAYFGVSAKELTLHQSAVLAGAIQSPSERDVDANSTTDASQADKSSQEYRALQASTRQVLERMLKQPQRDRARDPELIRLMDEDIPLTPYKRVPEKNYHNSEVIGAEYFVDMVIAQLGKVWGISTEETVKKLAQGYTVYTTLNVHDQAAMLTAVQANSHIRGTELDAAGVSVGKDGDIRAMVGGKDYHQSQVNMAIGEEGGSSGFPGGSSFKPFAAAGAIAAGMELNTLIDVSSPATVQGINGSQPLIVEPHSSVPQKTLRDVIATSDNVGAAHLVETMGLQRYLDVLKAFGVNGIAPYPSAILGAGEHDPMQLAQAFNGLILNQGAVVEAYSISKITNKEGTVIFERKPSTGQRIFEPQVAIEAVKAMIAVVQEGTAKDEIPPTANPNSDAGKTGTTDQNVVVWFSGSRCIASYGGQTASFMITNPKTKEPMQGITSHDAAGMFGAYISAVTDTNNVCDLATTTTPNA